MGYPFLIHFCCFQMRKFHESHHIFLAQEPIYNLLLGLCFGKSKRHELCDLFTCDLADGCLVDQRGIEMICGDLRHGADLCIVHDDRVALGMAGAAVISVDLRDEKLRGIFLGNGAGDEVCA